MSLFTAVRALVALLTAIAGVPAQALTWMAPVAVDLDRIVVSDSAGTERPLADVVAGGPAVIHFWATWCVPCRDELPAVDRFADTLADSGLAGRFVVVSVDRFGYDRVLAFVADELGLAHLHTLQDTSGMAGTVFRLFGYPATVVIDAQHRMVAKNPGPLDWDDASVRAALVERLR